MLSALTENQSLSTAPTPLATAYEHPDEDSIIIFMLQNKFNYERLH